MAAKNAPTAWNAVPSSGLGGIMRLFLFDLIGERRRVAILDGLKMFTVEHEFAVVFEDFVACAIQTHLFVFGGFLQVGLDGANGIADEHRLDDTQFVVAVGKRLGIDRARRHANRHAENERAMFADALFHFSLSDCRFYLKCLSAKSKNAAQSDAVIACPP